MAHAASGLATAANRSAAQHAEVSTKFDVLTARTAAGSVPVAVAESEAAQLGAIRASLEADMDSVLRGASAVLAQLLMPSILREAEALA